MSGGRLRGRNHDIPVAGNLARISFVGRMEILAFTVALAALAWGVISFWWLHARPGRLGVITSQSFASAAGVDADHPERAKLLLMLPLTFLNGGPTVLTIEDLALTLGGEGDSPFRWHATHTSLLGGDEERTWAQAFSVPPRGVVERTFEFQRETAGVAHTGVPASVDIGLQVLVHGERDRGWRRRPAGWSTVAEFTLNNVVWGQRLIARHSGVWKGPSTTDE